MKTPNCDLCEWVKVLHNNIDAKCTAQGYKYCEDAYNTKECQELYEVKGD